MARPIAHVICEISRMWLELGTSSLKLAFVISAFIAGIHPSAGCGALDPGSKCRDDKDKDSCRHLNSITVGPNAHHASSRISRTSSAVEILRGLIWTGR